MKNDGVPFTPLRTPLRKSLLTLGAYFSLTRALCNSDSDSPKAVASANKSGKTQAVLIFINTVMHVPEQPVRTGEFSALGGGFRIRVHLGQRKMPEDESQSRPEALQYHVHNRVRGSATRALVVAVLDQGHRGICGSPDMVMPRDWNF